jgi:hypothetical protein
MNDDAPTPEVANAGPGFLHVRGADYEGVIASAAGAWTPSPQQVARLEVALAAAIGNHPELGPPGPPSRFKRQYSGIEAKGRKVIRIDLSSQPPADWPASGLPSVKGGGAAHGFAHYDVVAGRITLLVPNSSK